MLSLFFKFCLFCLIILSTAFGQANKIVVGTMESNFTDFKPDKQNPFIGIIHFYKDNNEWNVLVDSLYSNKQDFNVYYKGLKVGAVSAQVDTLIERSPYFWFPFKFNSKKVPTVGRKSFLFSGMGGEKCYRPLIISNSSYSKQKHIPKYRNPNRNDSLLVANYLVETAENLNIGNLDSIKGKIIKKVNRVLVISKDCYFIDADINLNMYCYKDKVPFDTDLSYFLSSTQKYSISERKETYNSYFLVNKSKVTYIDYDLKYLDSGDFDNDGYEEIIFRMDKYNYTGYLMVTDKWNSFLTNSWSYH
jgi:hypothetical protein